WVPTFAEEVKTTRRRLSIWVGNGRHVLHSDYQLSLPCVHVHLPNARLTWRMLAFVKVLDPHIVGSAVFHPLKIVSQRCRAVGRQLVDRSRQSTFSACAEVMHTAHVLLAIV